MGDLIAGEDGEVLLARFRLDEFFSDGAYGVVDMISGGDADVDLLDLEVGESGSVRGADEHGGVKVDIIEVDGVVEEVEYADNHEFFV